MCTRTNHCLYHLLPRERDTGHNLRHRGHSYQLELACYNFSSTIGVALLFVCCMAHCNLVSICISANKLNTIFTCLLTAMETKPMKTAVPTARR